MTHDELLATINEEIKVCEPDCMSHRADNQPWEALRAVVELHKPDVRGNCDTCTYITGGGFAVYPCFTITAIEKELG